MVALLNALSFDLYSTELELSDTFLQESEDDRNVRISTLDSKYTKPRLHARSRFEDGRRVILRFITLFPSDTGKTGFIPQRQSLLYLNK